MTVSTATAVRPLAFGPSQGWSDGFPGNGSNARYLHRARPLLDLRRARLLQDLQLPPDHIIRLSGELTDRFV